MPLTRLKFTQLLANLCIEDEIGSPFSSSVKTVIVQKPLCRPTVFGRRQDVDGGCVGFTVLPFGNGSSTQGRNLNLKGRADTLVGAGPCGSPHPSALGSLTQW
jgi:hypothetical protein